MNLFRADLHTHTKCSDGTATGRELIDLARSLNLSGLSITDHDTVSAYEEALPYAASLGFPLLPGIEFSAHHGREPVHILGYAFSLKSEAILELCAEHATRRRLRNQMILQKLQKLGHKIEESELEGGHTIGRPHIALALVKRGVVGSVAEAFEHYLGEGKSAYHPGELISAEKTIDAIHQGRGIACIAHPHLLRRSTTIRHLMQLPFDGLEGYYAKMPREREQRWLTLAKERGWIVTGGSDFHGSVKPQTELGSSWTCKEVFAQLMDRYRSL